MEVRRVVVIKLLADLLLGVDLDGHRDQEQGREDQKYADDLDRLRSLALLVAGVADQIEATGQVDARQDPQQPQGHRPDCASGLVVAGSTCSTAATVGWC